MYQLFVTNQNAAPQHLVYEYQSNQPISWLYNYSEGGWNSVQASSKREAIRLAQEKSNLALDIDSFRPSTPQDFQNLMSSFY